jgi:hypothetical protein
VGPSGAASCPAKSSSGGIMWTKDGEKKRLIRLQVHPYRYSLTSLITPVRKNCREVPAGGGSSDLFATQRDDLCYHLHVVYPGRYNYSCSSVPASLYLWREGLFSEAKGRDMDRLAAATFDALWS